MKLHIKLAARSAYGSQGTTAEIVRETEMGSRLPEGDKPLGNYDGLDKLNVDQLRCLQDMARTETQAVIDEFVDDLGTLIERAEDRLRREQAARKTAVAGGPVGG